MTIREYCAQRKRLARRLAIPLGVLFPASSAAYCGVSLKLQKFFPYAIEARLFGARAIVISLLALLCTLAAPALRAVPLAVYGSLPSVEDVALSPDGSRVAYVRTEGDMRIIVVATVADRKMIRWARVGEDKLRWIEWADDDNLMLTTSVTSTVFGFKKEWFMLRTYNLTRNEIHTLPSAPPGADYDVSNLVSGRVMARRVDGHTVIFVPGWVIQRGLTLFRCDLTTGLTSLMRAGTEATESWLVGGQGQLASEEEYDRQTQRWSIKIFHGGSSREAVSGHAALEVPEVLGFGPTTDTLLVQSIENGATVWRLLSIKDGTLGAPMAADSVFYEPIADRSTHRLIGGVHLIDVPEYVFFDPALEDRWKSIVKAFDGDEVQFVSASSDYSKILVLVQGAKYGYCYELIDLDKTSATLVG